MLATFTIIPIGAGESISPIVAKVVKLVDSSNLDYRLTAMGTIVEGEWDEVLTLIKKAHKLVRRHSARVLTSITIDDRKGAKKRLTGKVDSVKSKLKIEVKS